MPIPTSTTSAHAETLKSLHTPGKPLLLANVYNAASAALVASHPGCRALATASYALAETISKSDDTLTLQENLSLTRPIAEVAAKQGLPLTVDVQDGYAPAGAYSTLAENIKMFITEFGAAGCNIEDSWHDFPEGKMMSEDEAVERIKTVVKTAREVLGTGGFVVNARSDTFFLGGGELEESIRRGKRYLEEGGATTVFIFWPRSKVMEKADVQKVIDAFGGMVNISCRLGGDLSTTDLAAMGTARISVGPQLWLAEKNARGQGVGEEQVQRIVREKVGEVFGL